MKKLVLLCAFLLTSIGCKTGASPAPTLTADQLTSELVDGGCLAAGPGVADAVAAEMAMGRDAWLVCLADGGSIVSCNVPCTRDR